MVYIKVRDEERSVQKSASEGVSTIYFDGKSVKICFGCLWSAIVLLGRHANN